MAIDSVASRRRAVEHLRLGYYEPKRTEVYVRCPDCRHHVHAYVVAWANPRERSRALVEALAAHLDEHLMEG